MNESEFKSNVGKLLYVHEGKINDIGKEKNALSVSWFKKNYYKKNIKILRKNIYNFFRNMTETCATERMWSTFGDYQSVCEDNGYKSCFIPFNTRATNDYRNRSTLAYAVNIYENPFIVNWFKEHGTPLNEDMIALSHLLQWVWRSQIRDGKAIELYLPSNRMRGILTNWLESG